MAKSPVTNKKQINFNFQDAWKAEGPTQNGTTKVQQPSQPGQPKNPMMNNIQKPTEQTKIEPKE